MRPGQTEDGDFKVEMSDDNARSFASNGLRFDTEDNAEAYACDLFSRWLAATHWRIVRISDGEIRTVSHPELLS